MECSRTEFCSPADLLEVGRDVDFGIAGTIGTVGEGLGTALLRGCAAEAFGVVTSRCADVGVVGVVDGALSEEGCVVDGVSARGVSTCPGKDPAVVVLDGRATGSSLLSNIFFLLRVLGGRVGQSELGCVDQGSWKVLALFTQFKFR